MFSSLVGKDSTEEQLLLIDDVAANVECNDEKKVQMDHQEKRRIANSNERRRMQNINAGFDQLRTNLSLSNNQKYSKASILQHAANHISELQKEYQETKRQLKKYELAKRICTCGSYNQIDRSKLTERCVELHDEGIGSPRDDTDADDLHRFEVDRQKSTDNLSAESKIKTSFKPYKGSNAHVIGKMRSVVQKKILPKEPYRDGCNKKLNPLSPSILVHENAPRPARLLTLQATPSQMGTNVIYAPKVKQIGDKQRIVSGEPGKLITIQNVAASKNKVGGNKCIKILPKPSITQVVQQLKPKFPDLYSTKRLKLTKRFSSDDSSPQPTKYAKMTVSSNSQGEQDENNKNKPQQTTTTTTSNQLVRGIQIKVEPDIKFVAAPTTKTTILSPVITEKNILMLKPNQAPLGVGKDHGDRHDNKVTVTKNVDDVSSKKTSSQVPEITLNQLNTASTCSSSSKLVTNNKFQVATTTIGNHHGDDTATSTNQQQSSNHHDDGDKQLDQTTPEEDAVPNEGGDGRIKLVIPKSTYYGSDSPLLNAGGNNLNTILEAIDRLERESSKQTDEASNTTNAPDEPSSKMNGLIHRHSTESSQFSD